MQCARLAVAFSCSRSHTRVWGEQRSPHRQRLQTATRSTHFQQRRTRSLAILYVEQETGGGSRRGGSLVGMGTQLQSRIRAIPRGRASIWRARIEMRRNWSVCPRRLWRSTVSSAAHDRQTLTSRLRPRATRPPTVWCRAPDRLPWRRCTQNGSSRDPAKARKRTLSIASACLACRCFGTLGVDTEA